MILVTGATGYTGRVLLRELVRKGCAVRCLVRATSDVDCLQALGVEWAVADLAEGGLTGAHFDGVRQLVHVAPIWLCRALVDQLTPAIEVAVFISSLRRLSTVPSRSVDAVATGERLVQDSGFPATILRPSMIYGPGDDRNISRLARHFQKRSLIPVIGSGRYLQQPVHVGDVVRAITAALGTPAAKGKVYAIAGPEAMSFNDLLDLVGGAVNSKPRKVHFPAALGLAASRCMRFAGISAGLDPEQIRRLQEDKVFDIEPARRDLGFEPMALSEGLQQIYGGSGGVHG